jgi:hypothetical protein
LENKINSKKKKIKIIKSCVHAANWGISTKTAKVPINMSGP